MSAIDYESNFNTTNSILARLTLQIRLLFQSITGRCKCRDQEINLKLIILFSHRLNTFHRTHSSAYSVKVSLKILFLSYESMTHANRLPRKSIIPLIVTTEIFIRGLISIFIVTRKEREKVTRRKGMTNNSSW